MGTLQLRNIFQTTKSVLQKIIQIIKKTVFLLNMAVIIILIFLPPGIIMQNSHTTISNFTILGSWWQIQNITLNHILYFFWISGGILIGNFLLLLHIKKNKGPASLDKKSSQK